MRWSGVFSAECLFRKCRRMQFFEELICDGCYEVYEEEENETSNSDRKI